MYVIGSGGVQSSHGLSCHRLCQSSAKSRRLECCLVFRVLFLPANNGVSVSSALHVCIQRCPRYLPPKSRFCPDTMLRPYLNGWLVRSHRDCCERSEHTLSNARQGGGELGQQTSTNCPHVNQKWPIKHNFIAEHAKHDESV